MNNRWAIVLGGVLVAILVAASVVTMLKVDLTPKEASGKRVERTRNLGEGLRLTRHGLYGVDLVSIGKAHTRKLRKGPFTIGAINELVLEDVSLALPEELWKGEGKGEGCKVKGEGEGEGQQAYDSKESGPRAMLGKLGLEAGLTKLQTKLPRFSAMVIKNLGVSRLEGTNAVPWFAASNGKAERGGLHLYTGWSVENGVTNGWKEAFLAVEPSLKLWTPKIAPAGSAKP